MAKRQSKKNKAASPRGQTSAARKGKGRVAAAAPVVEAPTDEEVPSSGEVVATGAGTEETAEAASGESAYASDAAPTESESEPAEPGEEQAADDADPPTPLGDFLSDAEPGSEREDDAGVEDTHAYLKGLIEALLFVSDRPLELKELARGAKLDRKRTEELLAELRIDHQSRGMRIEEVAGGFAFRSNPAYSAAVRHFLAQRPVRLSRAQLETLSIVAYRQPITRPEVDDIRGVDTGPVLKGLLERELVRIIGKKDEPGRPMLYGTTPAFLELFSMSSLQDLPTLKEFTELSDDSKVVFEKETGEEAPDGDLQVTASEEADTDPPAEADAGTAEENAPEETSAALEPAATDDEASEDDDASDEDDQDEDEDEDDDDDDDDDD